VRNPASDQRMEGLYVPAYFVPHHPHTPPAQAGFLSLAIALAKAHWVCSRCGERRIQLRVDLMPGYPGRARNAFFNLGMA
jgi:hypothetical protein